MFQTLQNKIKALFQRRRLDREMDEELRSHLELRTRSNIEAGMNPEEARFAAMRQFGHTDGIKETCRDQRGARGLETLIQDTRFSMRQLRKSPGFAAIAIITLALGIGANTVVFSVAKAVLFRSFGFEQVERLSWIRIFDNRKGTVEESISLRDLQDITESTRSFEALTMFGSPGDVWVHDDKAETVTALTVMPNLADILRVRPLLGRMIESADCQENAEPVALISYEMWQGRFGGKPDVVGQSVHLSERVYTIVGVLPPGLKFPLERAANAGTGNEPKTGTQSFWLPLRIHGNDAISRASRMFSALGRLKPDVTEAAARNELDALGRRLAGDFPDTNRGVGFTLVSFRDQILGSTRQGIVILSCAVGAVLLICCVNLANLLLARGITRQHELAVRLALGAGRRRLVQTALAESILLSLLGGALGILLAWGALHGIRQLAAVNVPFVRESTIDVTVLAFTVGLSVLTAVVFGLLPLLGQARIGAADSLRHGARVIGGSRIRLWQQSLLTGQIAVVLALVASAGLLLESFRRLMGQELGYKPQSVVTIDITTWNFTTNEGVCQLYRRLRELLAAIPGVEAVGTVSSAPLTGKWVIDEKAQVVGHPLPVADRPSLTAGFVAFDYFQAIGTPLVEGRFFRDNELKDTGYGQIVILNEAAASLLFPGRPAIGGRFTVESNPDRALEVIGVVKDTRDIRLDLKPTPKFYWQYAFGGAQLIVRVNGSARAIAPMLRQTVEAADSRIINTELRLMSDIVSGTIAERTFLMVLLTAYAAIALGIAAVGTYGVVACQVAQRTNEFGVRLALGAGPRELFGLVLKQAGRLVLIGVGCGLVISFATNRLLASQLFDLSPHDPLLLFTVCGVLLLMTLLATFVPARNAAQVDPMVALRHE